MLNRHLQAFLLGAASLFSVFASGEVEWLYSGSTIAEQNVEEGARGWILKVSSSGTGLLQCTGISQSGTNVAGAATSRRLLDMNAPIKDASGAEYKINKFSNALFKDSTLVDTIILPSELVSIPQDAMRGAASTLKRIVITGDKIKSIGTYAFYKNASITNITGVFNGLNSIGKGAFTGCSNLRGEIVINSGNFVFVSGNDGNNGTFQGCSKLEGVVVNGDVTGVLPRAIFHSCTSLKRVQLSNNPTNLITGIELYAFYNCTSLTDISPLRFSKLTSIADGAFYNCSLLKGIFSVESSKLQLSAGNSYGTFYQCKKLDIFKNYGDIVGTLPAKAFHTCSALKQLQLTTNTVAKLSSLATMSIFRCSSLTNIHPLVFDRLTTIESSALSESPLIKGDFIIIGSKPLSVGQGALSGSMYTSFSVEGAVTSIGGGFLQNCTTITNVYFGSTVAGLADSFLNGCKALRVLTMPYRPASFGGTASFNNISERQIVIRADKDDTGADGWLNSVRYTPWRELSQSVKNEWLNLSYEAKKARGWQDIKVPRGVTLGLAKNQWLTDIPSSHSLFMLR